MGQSVKEHGYHRRGFPLCEIIAVKYAGLGGTAARELHLLLLDFDKNGVQLIYSASLSAPG